MSEQLTIALPDLAATQQLAQQVAALVAPGQTIALNGTLGSGKTQWTRYFCEALGVPAELVTSPTYVLQQVYRGTRLTVHHFDFYRLESKAQVWDLGFDELQESPVVILVEWAEKFPETLPLDCLEIQLFIADNGGRTAELRGTGSRSASLIRQL